MKKYIFALSLIVFLAYLNSFGNSFVWDDFNNIIHNRALDGPIGLREVFLNPTAQIFYRPFSYLTIWLDQFFWKDNPFGYHFTNFAFHLACIFLIFFLCQRLTQSANLAFISSLIFAVHPVHTEAVSYISGRSDLICGFFIFLSFYLYLHFLDSVDKRKFLYLSAALFSYLMALFSKEVALIFPFIILCYSLYFYRDRTSRLRDKKWLLLGNSLCAVLAISYLLFRHFFVKFSSLHLHLGEWYLFPKIFLSYLRLLIFPFNLHMQHDLQEDSFLLQMPLFLSTLLFLGIIVTAVKYVRGTYARFGLAWFVLWLFPFLGIFKFNSGLAEHWLYIGSFGFFLISGKLISQNNILRNKFIFPCIILFFCFLTIQRNAIWQDDVSIYRDTLRYRPSDHKLHYNLGNAYLRRGMFTEASKEYSIAIEGSPGYAYALNNLGLALEEQGDTREAQKHYEKAIVSNPQLVAAKKNLLRLGFTSLAFAQNLGFDHTLYGKVLRKFVYDGKVDYVSLKNNPSILDNYLRKVAGLDNDVLNSMPENEKIAFYINVYNAITLKVIVDYYPVKSIKDIRGVWDKIKFKVAGRELTLNRIEHEILRNEFKEPRIHFALVCASGGCPKLAGEPFSGKNLDEQLDREARKFINDETKVKLDRNRGALYISSIFKWFNEDFGDVIKFISRYLSGEDAEFIEKTKPKIRYLHYDWSLNEKL
jgi:hypothetical protein